VLNRLAHVQAGEWAAVLWSFAYFFCILCSYYVVRPVRDEMGIQAGVGNLPWLFTATFFVMLAAAPLFGWVSSRFPRRQFLPFVYLFFVANLLLFFLLFRQKAALEVTTKAFFVWVSVFNLFVVSVFWSFMADLFDTVQARRLYGFIAAGGSLGAITGPTLSGSLAVPLGPVNLLLVSGGFLLGAVLCIQRLGSWSATHVTPGQPKATTGSSGPIPGRYQISPNLHASYTMQTGVSVEKQLSKSATVSVTYLNSQGGDSYLTRDINAPLPGTFNPNDPSSGVAGAECSSLQLPRCTIAPCSSTIACRGHKR
jgi:MFS family permease